MTASELPKARGSFGKDSLDSLRSVAGLAEKAWPGQCAQASPGVVVCDRRLDSGRIGWFKRLGKPRPEQSWRRAGT